MQLREVGDDGDSGLDREEYRGKDRQRGSKITAVLPEGVECGFPFAAEE